MNNVHYLDANATQPLRPAAREAVFAARVEESLLQPTHVIGFPRDISPLAKADGNDARLVERFETTREQALLATERTLVQLATEQLAAAS